MSSISDDDCEDFILFPIHEYSDSGSTKKKDSVSGRVSFSVSESDAVFANNIPIPGKSHHPLDRACSLPNGGYLHSHPKPPISAQRSQVLRKYWRNAIRKSRMLKDPWASHLLHNIATETALRYRYNAVTKTWVTDEVAVKIESQSFAHGAMRQCFRLKKAYMLNDDKLSWKYNYVAKQYFEKVARDVYFEDVRLQMDAKLWGEEYNRHNPPKKVDIMQMSVIEFVGREGKPLYHIEHFIEGVYIKYNSNSGFVEDEAARCTPQAFSHFTFERSDHEVIVVDVQGVGDLYTDPQIHTANGKGYGDGDLGTKGMALFFRSHVCNRICRGFSLEQFDLSDREREWLRDHERKQIAAKTQCRGAESMVMSSAREARRSGSSLLSSPPSSPLTPDWPQSPDEGIECPLGGAYPARRSESSDDGVWEPVRPPFPRRRKDTVLQEEAEIQNSEMETALGINRLAEWQRRPSHVGGQLDFLKLNSKLESIGVGSSLGRVHLDLAKYHEMGRFNHDDIDMDSALFHLEQAAVCDVLEAIIAMSRLYSGLVNDVLPDAEVAVDVGKAFEYLVQAAEAGDRRSMVLLARCYDTGEGLPADRDRDWLEATYWYEEAIGKEQEDEGGEFDAITDDPSYSLLARLAEMHQLGGFHLDVDYQKGGDLFTSAADAAMAAMKGRMANKYYAFAEECWGMIDE